MKLFDFILRPCMCYGLIVAMATSLIQNFKYNQKRLRLVTSSYRNIFVVI